MMPKVRLAYLVTHPIQYQAPLLRRIAAEPDIDLTVFFGSDFSLKSYLDPAFGKVIAWDVDLTGGYRHGPRLQPLVPLAGHGRGQNAGAQGVGAG
jgi:hypothetical protein